MSYNAFKNKDVDSECYKNEETGFEFTPPGIPPQNVVL